jgi:glucose-1-phosphate thymidylyltransferase
MILGDNIFHGVGLGQQLSSVLPSSGAHIFIYEVSDPSQYGVLTLDKEGKPIQIVEKPSKSTSNFAVTGLYFFDKNVSAGAKQVKPSARGELEITAVIEWYLEKTNLTFTKLTRGTAWLDTGNPNAMHDAATYIRVIEERTGLKIGCLEEIAYEKGLISIDSLASFAQLYSNSIYGQYLKKIHDASIKSKLQ